MKDPHLEEDVVVDLGGLVCEQHACAQAVGGVPEVLQGCGLDAEALNQARCARGVCKGRRACSGNAEILD